MWAYVEGGNVHTVYKEAKTFILNGVRYPSNMFNLWTDSEKEEEKYHIMTVMKQALTAARSRQGFIDEGNNIYLQDMGINGATAQALIFQYLKKEKDIFDAGKEPSHELTMEFLESCYEKFKGCSLKYSEKRGFTLMDKKSLHIGEN